MAIYTTYFVGTEAEIAAALPESRPRLLAPVRAKRMNPFTKQEVEYTSWDPADAPGAPVEHTPGLDRALIRACTRIRSRSSVRMPLCASSMMPR